jgi:hypothetical protein
VLPYRYGFYLTKTGAYTTIVVPGAVQTQIRGISPDGLTIVGSYLVCNKPEQMFVLKQGVFSFPRLNEPDGPGALAIGRTAAFGINKKGAIVGGFSLWNRPADEASDRGFVLRAGKFVEILVPGSRITNAFDVKGDGVVVGSYRTFDDSEPVRGFIYR